jgi:putative transposase
MGMPPLLIQLDAAERKELERLANRPSTPQQLAQRMRIVLLAADGLNNVQISEQLGVSTKMVRYWRRRWKESAGGQPPPLMDRLSDRERPGAPMKFSLTQQVDVLAMACRRPEDYGIEASQWTARMLRDKAVEEGIIGSISVRQVRRWLNEADLKPHQIRYWLFPPSGS